MRIVSVLEDKNFEKRIAITPEIAKKYISIGIDVSLPEGYGYHLGFNDEEYKKIGVDLVKDEKIFLIKLIYSFNLLYLLMINYLI